MVQTDISRHQKKVLLWQKRKLLKSLMHVLLKSFEGLSIGHGDLLMPTEMTNRLGCSMGCEETEGSSSVREGHEGFGRGKGTGRVKIL
jgi:hypothetical protein